VSTVTPTTAKEEEEFRIIQNVEDSQGYYWLLLFFCSESNLILGFQGAFVRPKLINSG
jgi:hypothetical protein